MFIGEIKCALDLWREVYDFFKKKKDQNSCSGELDVVKRFVQLFEEHGVHRNQIPKFFEHELLPKDIYSDESLLEVLTEEMLDDACALFAVRREWLDGVDEQIYPLHDFYKWPDDFRSFLENIEKEQLYDKKMHGILLSPSRDCKDFWAEDLLILEETIGCIGSKAIHRYHLCNNWLFRYWKSRAYLTACIAVAWKAEVFVHGRRVENSFIKELSQGTKFLPHNGETALPYYRGVHWHPEDMAISPEAFLEDIDPEKDNFGIRSGLQLWLHLFKEDFMDTGLHYNTPSIIARFRRELSKYPETEESILELNATGLQ